MVEALVRILISSHAPGFRRSCLRNQQPINSVDRGAGFLRDRKSKSWSILLVNFITSSTFTFSSAITPLGIVLLMKIKTTGTTLSQPGRRREGKLWTRLSTRSIRISIMILSPSCNWRSNWIIFKLIFFFLCRASERASASWRRFELYIRIAWYQISHDDIKHSKCVFLYSYEIQIVSLL